MPHGSLSFHHSVPVIWFGCSECQSCPEDGKQPRDGYLASWSWNTLSQDKSVGRNSRHKSHTQRTKTAIYKAPSWWLGFTFPWTQGATAPSWKRFFHPQLRAWDHRKPMPISSENRAQHAGWIRGGDRFSDEPEQRGVQWHRWPL